MVMKKPKITKGEWVYSKGQITEQEGYAIAEYVSEHDGQAISAVPEMIDALILARGALIGAGFTHEGLVLNDIDKALKKAGVEL